MDIYLQNSNKIKNALSFSLALDETTDKRNVAQLCVFFRAVLPDFTIVTDFLSISPLHMHTTGEDILKAFSEITNKYSISLQNCSQIATVGAPSMMKK